MTPEQQYKDLASYCMLSMREARLNVEKYGCHVAWSRLKKALARAEEKLEAIETPTRQQVEQSPCISPKAEEKLKESEEQWYLCDADLYCGELCFKKGGRYKGNGFNEFGHLCLINEEGWSHAVPKTEHGAWLKHFTLITANQLRVEVEDGREPSEIEMNQNIKG